MKNFLLEKSFFKFIAGLKITNNSNNSYSYGSTDRDLKTIEITLQEDEFINKVDYTNWMSWLYSLTFYTNLGNIYGPFGEVGCHKDQSKPLEPERFLAGIRNVKFDVDVTNYVSSMEFCWGYVNNKVDGEKPV